LNLFKIYAPFKNLLSFETYVTIAQFCQPEHVEG
jgi:hypothetical protein